MLQLSSSSQQRPGLIQLRLELLDLVEKHSTLSFHGLGLLMDLRRPETAGTLDKQGRQKCCSGGEESSSTSWLAKSLLGMARACHCPRMPLPTHAISPFRRALLCSFAAILQKHCKPLATPNVPNAKSTKFQLRDQCSCTCEERCSMGCNFFMKL